MDLVLDFKIDESSTWKRLKPTQAKERLRNEGEAAREITTSDLGELLGDNPTGGDEAEDDQEY